MYSWHYLQEDFATAAPAFNEFLSRFPLCYMYWKKYADMAAKNVGDDRAREVCQLRMAFRINTL